MTEAVVRVVRRPGALPALLTSAGILAYLIVREFLGTLIMLPWVTGDGVQDDLAVLWSGSALTTLATSLPFTVGVFLSFWQIAPIAGSLRLAHVVTRALLAALTGAVFSFVVSVVAVLVRYLLAGDLVGGLGSSTLVSLAAAGGLILALAPLVVLGAVLLWGWLQRHPLDYVPRGTLDEV